MALFVLRCIFVVATVGLVVRLVGSPERFEDPAWPPWVLAAGASSGALLLLVADILLRRKKPGVILAVFSGLLLGLLLTTAAGLALMALGVSQAHRPVPTLVVGLLSCYACVSLLLQLRDDFRSLVPHVERAGAAGNDRPFILDTSAVIDGRIADVVDTHILDRQLIVPRCVVGELQGIADSSDRLRRTRGRRGLDILNRLREDAGVNLLIDDREPPEAAGQPVDQKLVLLAKHLEGKVVTNDYNLNKVAQLHGVEVINLNDLANALKPAVLPGEHLNVQIIRPGDQFGQGVGYLDDGTMVVVEAGREHIDQDVKITVTSVTQTSAGRMIFGRYEQAGQV